MNFAITFNVVSIDILDTATLSKILQEHNVIDTQGTVAPRWVLKYHVFVRCRSIVRDKG